MDDKLVFPDKPKPILSKDGRWRIIPCYSVLRVEPLEPRSQLEADAVKRHGRLYRIVYSSDMYDAAIMRAKDLYTDLGIKRIEFVLANREEQFAVWRGDYIVVAVNDVEG